MRKLSAGFAISVDGFIQGTHGEIDWIVQDKEQWQRLTEYWRQTDTMLYGRKTYQMVIEHARKTKGIMNPFAHMTHYVFSSSIREVEPRFKLVRGDTLEEVRAMKAATGKNIAVFGGAELTSSLINLGLIDELVLAISPVILGDGMPLFNKVQKNRRFHLHEVVPYSSGLVCLTYQKNAQ